MKVAVISFTHPFESNNFTISRAFDLPIKEVKNNKEEESGKERKFNLKDKYYF